MRPCMIRHRLSQPAQRRCLLAAVRLLSNVTLLRLGRRLSMRGMSFSRTGVLAGLSDCQVHAHTHRLQDAGHVLQDLVRSPVAEGHASIRQGCLRGGTRT